MLSAFEVIHGASDFFDRGPLVQCFDGDRRVLAVITRKSLDDLFGLRRATPKERSALVDGNNLLAFGRIISAKYKAGKVGCHPVYGTMLPLVTVTLDDIKASGERFTEATSQTASHGRSPDTVSFR